MELLPILYRSRPKIHSLSSPYQLKEQEALRRRHDQFIEHEQVSTLCKVVSIKAYRPILTGMHKTRLSAETGTHRH